MSSASVPSPSQHDCQVQRSCQLRFMGFWFSWGLSSNERGLAETAADRRRFETVLAAAFVISATPGTVCYFLTCVVQHCRRSSVSNPTSAECQGCALGKQFTDA